MTKRDDMPDYLAGMLAYWHSIDWRDLPKLAQIDGWFDAHCAHYLSEQDYMGFQR